MAQVKRVNIKSSIKKQLNGHPPKLEKIDTQDSQVLSHLEADMLYNASNYTRVNILGVDVHVKVGDEP